MIKNKPKFTEYEELPPIPFDPDELERLIKFKCKECGFEEEISADFVDESFIPEEFDNETGSPIFECIKCGGNMIIKELKFDLQLRD